MSKNRSSFYMGNEFNGYAKASYLKGTERKAYSPVSQTNVKLPSDLSSSIAKVLGAIPVYIDANQADPLMLMAVAAVPQVNMVYVTYDEKSGTTSQTFKVASSGVTTGSYFQGHSSQQAVSVPLNPLKGSWILEDNKKWRYYESDVYSVNQWIYHATKWYYVDRDGYMVVGWLEKNNNWYYLSSEIDANGVEQKGHMFVGWREIAGLWYYFISVKNEAGIEQAGHMVTGWEKIDGKWYYFKTKNDSNNGIDYGYLYSNKWINYNGSWYYLDNNGEMLTSKLIKWEGKQYFLKADGSMAVNETVVDPITKKTYKADQDGVCREIKNGIIKIALSDSRRFIEIIDESNKYYGGDQDWYNWPSDLRKTNIAQQGGCGTVASANIVAYLAGHNSKYKGLYAYSDYTKVNFLLHMEDMYKYVTPRSSGDNPLGVWPISMMEKGVEEFASDKGIELNAVRKGGPFSRENITEYIKDGLEKDSPVAMLIGARNINVNFTLPGGTPYPNSFQLHWVTITELIIDETNNKVKVKVSSWGGWAEVDLDEYLQEPLYQGLLYFE